MNTARAVVIACNFNAAYAPHAAVMMLSALKHVPETIQVRFHCLTDPEFPIEQQELLQKVLAPYGYRSTLYFHAIPHAWVEGLPLLHFMKPGSMPPVMWYRVFLSRVLDGDSKVLYLDCDTLVMDDLLPLWNTDLADHALAAVTDPFWGSERHWPARMGLPTPEGYFNSGVMLLNLDWWRRTDMVRLVVEHGRTHASQTRYGDQDSLVALLHTHRLALSPRWNMMRMMMLVPHARSLFGLSEIVMSSRWPGIVHFEGFTKPWIDPSKHPYGRAYQDYAKQLPWPIVRRAYNLNDLENFLIRRQRLRPRRWIRRMRERLGW